MIGKLWSSTVVVFCRSYTLVWVWGEDGFCTQVQFLPPPASVLSLIDTSQLAPLTPLFSRQSQCLTLFLLSVTVNVCYNFILAISFQLKIKYSQRERERERLSNENRGVMFDTHKTRPLTDWQRALCVWFTHKTRSLTDWQRALWNPATALCYQSVKLWQCPAVGNDWFSMAHKTLQIFWVSAQGAVSCGKK